MSRALIPILLIFLFGTGSLQAQSINLTSDDPPYPCPYPDGAFYQGEIFPRYEVDTGNLALVDPATNSSIRVLDTFTENIRIINWSPDCRYLTGAVGEINFAGERFDAPDNVNWDRKDIVFWDTLNEERIATFEDNPQEYLYNPTVIWRPNGETAIVLGGTYDGWRWAYDFLWQRSTNSTIRLGGLPLDKPRTFSRGTFKQYFWDESRNWLWSSANSGVVAYDLSTGLEVAFFANGGWVGSRFAFSPDSTKVVVYTTSAGGSSGTGELTIYDIAAVTGTPINVEGLAAPEIPPFADYHPVALSADNRYLVVGYDALRVWDIQNLPENVEDRLPIYRHGGPQAHIWSVRFSDWGIIETNSEEGIQHWDLHTGIYIPE